jgi:3-hydroxybutyryl-CoA dehydrogenase
MMAPLAPSVAVAVVGAGTMGAGIAQVAAAAGHRVLLYDAEQAALAKAEERIAGSLARAVDKGRLAPEERDRRLDRITRCDSVHALAPAGLVIEAIAEDLDAKVRLFQTLEVVCRSEAIFASNTSSLSITALAAGLQHPERMVGMHFFNPAPAMALIEVVRGLASAPEVVESVRATAAAWGKTPVVCRSTPGFIVNRVARPFYGEALRALAEGASDVATIDAVMRGAGGFRMGPFELIDLIGLDVNLAVSRSIHAGYSGDPRYTPSLLQQELVEAGRLGQKRGYGFYDHAPEAARPEPRTAAPAPPPKLIVVEGELGLAEPLIERFRSAGIEIDRRWGEGLIRIGKVRLALTDGRGATEWSHLLQAPVVLFDLALDFASCTHIAVEPADQASEGDLAQAAGLFQAGGLAVSVIDDFPGMLLMRTVCMLANEAADAVHTGVASAEAVDQAMRLGVNYPRGPLEWAEAVGLERVRDVLDHLARTYGEDRYRASWLLRRKALAKQSFRA